jgi:hypothetical protein
VECEDQKFLKPSNNKQSDARDYEKNCEQKTSGNSARRNTGCSSYSLDHSKNSLKASSANTASNSKTRQLPKKVTPEEGFQGQEQPRWISWSGGPKEPVHVETGRKTVRMTNEQIFGPEFQTYQEWLDHHHGTNRTAPKVETISSSSSSPVVNKATKEPGVDCENRAKDDSLNEVCYKPGRDSRTRAAGRKKECQTPVGTPSKSKANLWNQSPGRGSQDFTSKMLNNHRTAASNKSQKTVDNVGVGDDQWETAPEVHGEGNKNEDTGSDAMGDHWGCGVQVGGWGETDEHQNAGEQGEWGHSNKHDQATEEQGAWGEPNDQYQDAGEQREWGQGGADDDYGWKTQDHGQAHDNWESGSAFKQSTATKPEGRYQKATHRGSGRKSASATRWGDD